jgi:purine-nucleoside phosphorylase
LLGKIKQAEKFIRSQYNTNPEIGIILGTGLNHLAQMVEAPVEIPFAQVPNMPVSTAPSHHGKFILGKLSRKNVILMQGRLHYYEGYSMQEITFPIRIMKSLGASLLIVTNAAGSLNEEFQPGDIIRISDHLNLMGNNPLIGKNYDKLGERFPSLHNPYNQHLGELSQNIATDLGFTLKSGVYAGLSGPSLETKAECNMLVTLGADLVGMSTVPEVIVAIHSKMEVIGFSVVTNLSNIFHSQPHTQEEIQANAAKARKNLEALIINLIKNIERK